MQTIKRKGVNGKPRVAPVSNTENDPKRTEVQSHGFSWEQELMTKVYGATQDELKEITYTSKIDLPSNLNRLDKCDVSIKTSCSPNAVCMADCLRIFDAVSKGVNDAVNDEVSKGDSKTPIHMVVVHYKQDGSKKKVASITEIDLTSSRELLFGNLTREQIEELDRAVKSVPQKRKPTDEEYKKMYSIRDMLQKESAAIHLDIKCNSTQSRLQCSFNHFQDFIKNNPSRVVEKSNTNEFRGGKISSEIESLCRVFKKTL